MSLFPPNSSFFFFNDTATTEIYTLSLHDALPISKKPRALILDMTDVIHMDASGLHTLRQIHKECQSRGIRFMIAGIHAQPLTVLDRADQTVNIGETNMTDSVATALRSLEL